MSDFQKKFNFYISEIKPLLHGYFSYCLYINVDFFLPSSVQAWSTYDCYGGPCIVFL